MTPLFYVGAYFCYWHTDVYTGGTKVLLDKTIFDLKLSASCHVMGKVSPEVALKATLSFSALLHFYWQQ